MNKGTGGGILSAGYSLLFFAFLFGPLIIMVFTAFNSSSFPRVTPWECFTTDWFSVLLQNERLMEGLGNSVIIGLGVVAISIPLGLAGALALSELGPKLRATLYTVLIVPILIPGVVLGISTIVFWGFLGRSVGASYDSLFYNGMFLTLAGQVTFISAYAMLVFLARLQRFDPTLTEAALDLGATPGQAFRKIMLPFLSPAIGSAAFLSLLASFENYNTTVFTILSGNTFTTALASKVRLGTDPSLSALAVIIISITLVGAMVHEAHARRKEVMRNGTAARSKVYGNPVLRVLVHPASVMVILVSVIGFSTYQGAQHDSSVCEQQILDEKLERQRMLREEQRKKIEAQRKAQEVEGATEQVTKPKSPSAFGGAFGNAAPQVEKPKSPSAFGGAFGGGLAPKAD